MGGVVVTAHASIRHADDPKSFLEQATSTRDLRPLFALQRIDDLTRAVIEVHEGHVSTHYETCYQYHAGCLAARFLRILKEES